MYQRKPTRVVTIGNVKIGGNNKIAIQSMTCTKTKDKQATLNQINALYKAGCDIVRVAVLDIEDANALHDIVLKSPVPIVADIHFDYRLALIAAENNVAKIRINPGNIGSLDRIKMVVDACKEKHIPIRIGVNTGSINKDIQTRYGNSAYALVESAKEHIKILEDFDFHDIVVSIKASSVTKTIEAYTLFSEQYDYPVHIGVTEAGTILSGSIKSSVAIGYLLLNGIGDTIRVSLTDDPVQEVIAAKEILSSIGLYEKPELVSCPTCGRCQYNMIPIAKEMDEFLNTKKGKIKVAVMGCAVNGPGEAKDSDIGIAGGYKSALLFKKGIVERKIPEVNIVRDLKAEINMYLDKISYAYYNKLNEDIIRLRTNIFMNEQGFEKEFDNIDNSSKFVCIYKDDIAIGTRRFYKVGDTTFQIGRICIDKDYRNKGYGSIILMLLESKIISLFENESKTIAICASCQEQAKDFYFKNGYVDCHDDHYDEKVLHLSMRKVIEK